MPEPSALVAFFTALFFLEITPGPDMMLVLANGIGRGRRAAMLTAAGAIFVSGVVQVGLLVLGVASLLQTYASALAWLRWAGAAYLIYMGLQMMRAGGLGQAAPVVYASSWQALREGTVNNLMNPQSLLFMFAFLPQFVNPSAGPVWVQLLVLGSIQKLAGIVSLGGVALASGAIGQWLRRWPGVVVWQNRFTGLVLVVLGVRLLTLGGGPAGIGPGKGL